MLVFKPDLKKVLLACFLLMAAPPPPPRGSLSGESGAPAPPPRSSHRLSQNIEALMQLGLSGGSSRSPTLPKAAPKLVSSPSADYEYQDLLQANPAARKDDKKEKQTEQVGGEYEYQDLRVPTQKDSKGTFHEYLEPATLAPPRADLSQPQTSATLRSSSLPPQLPPRGSQQSFPEYLEPSNVVDEKPSHQYAEPAALVQSPRSSATLPKRATTNAPQLPPRLGITRQVTFDEHSEYSEEPWYHGELSRNVGFCSLVCNSHCHRMLKIAYERMAWPRACFLFATPRMASRRSPSVCVMGGRYFTTNSRLPQMVHICSSATLGLSQRW